MFSTMLAQNKISTLSALPINQWRVKVLIGVGWHDGLTHGICLYDEPECSLMFEQIAYDEERCRFEQTASAVEPREFDTRLLRLYLCSSEVALRLVERLRADESTNSPNDILWFPVDSPNQEQLDDLLSRLEAERTLLPVIAEVDGNFQIQRLWHDG